MVAHWCGLQRRIGQQLNDNLKRNSYNVKCVNTVLHLAGAIVQARPQSVARRINMCSRQPAVAPACPLLPRPSSNLPPGCCAAASIPVLIH